MDIELPTFRCTEEAVAYGKFITRDEYIFLWGALAALQQECAELKHVELDGGQRRVILATKIQLVRECLDVAPALVLASLIGGNRCRQRDVASGFSADGQSGSDRPLMSGSGV